MTRPVHFEIHGDDPEAATAFYAAALGWTVERWGEAPYWLYTTGEGPGIDGAQAENQEHGQKVVITVEVENLVEAVARVREAGGTILVESGDIPGVGTYAQFLDPNGVVMGMLEPAPES